MQALAELEEDERLNDGEVEIASEGTTVRIWGN